MVLAGGVLKFPWVLEPFVYDDQERLLAALMDKVIRASRAEGEEADRGLTHIRRV
jgi:hypothetical protein